MAIAFTYGADAGSSASSTTITRAATFTSGDGVVVWVHWLSSTITITGVADGTNTYLQVGTTVVDSLRGRSSATFYCKNAATGTPTITATFSLAVANRAIAYIKVSGHDNTANAQTGKGQAQGSTGTGADAATTTAMTPTSQPNGVFAVCISQINGPTVTAGTGFAALSTIVGYNALASDTSGTEWKRTTSISTVAGTFTLSASDEPNNIGVIITEAGGGGGAKPFIPIDFFLYNRLPRPQNYNASARTDLIGKDVFFGGAGLAPDYDWPNPLKWRTRSDKWPIDLRTYTDASEFWMLKDTFFGAPGQVNNYNWTNPRIAGFPLELRTLLENLLETTLAPTIAPFYVTEWTNPKRINFPLDLRTFTDASEFWMLRDQFFGVGGNPNYSWPNPQVKMSRTQMMDVLNLLETTLGPSSPVTVILRRLLMGVGT